MKKRFRFWGFGLAMLMAVSPVFSGQAFGALVDATGNNYGGDYLLIYNKNTDSTADPQAIGQIVGGNITGNPAGGGGVAGSMETIDVEKSPEEALMAELGAEGLQIQNITTIDGQLAVQIDPQMALPDLDQFKNQIKPAADNGQGTLYSLQKSGSLLGTSRTFVSIDMTQNNQTYDVPATCFYDGEGGTDSYCSVYVEDSALDQTVTAAQAISIGQEFDAQIRNFVQGCFGDYLCNDSSGTIDREAYETNGKIIILLENIRDQYGVSDNRSYYAGYFAANDILRDGTPVVMIHVDTYPTINNGDLSICKSTVAHEFQHLVNFTDYFKSFETQSHPNETWLNEMMSMAAEEALYGVLNNRITEFNNSSVVQNGAVLAFDNYGENSNDLGANYGLPYLFGQYLRIETDSADGIIDGGYDIFKKILASDEFGTGAVEAGLVTAGYSITDWDTFVRNFHIATVLNEEDSAYGFHWNREYIDGSGSVVGSETALKAVSRKLYTGSLSGDKTLYGTGALVVQVPATATAMNVSGGGADISYAAFSTSLSTASLNMLTEDLEVDTLLIVDSQGVNLTARRLQAAAGQEITVQMLLKNKTVSEIKSPSFIAGWYNANGRLCQVGADVSQTPITVSGNSWASASFTVPSDVSTGDVLRLFLLSGSDTGYHPVMEKFDIQ